ncbi:hypothetical protein FE275_11760 [Pseudomonas koreensis]|uniref:hypothetical protein n=1 Tax=Pseudomonas TaxID=286 RepID=UPI0005977D8C|nr:MULTISPECIES: hypothetical protein [Pseudomonas]KAA8740615.1 hypothetical protein FE275_11760 [Pseudomonas koreensis]KIK84086.1 hypothetical protein OC71_22220 [Pseudomonas sp. W15Feb9B]
MLSKRLFTGAALLTVSISAQAGISKAEYLKGCNILENAAMVVMQARQEGAPMATLWEISEKNDNKFIAKMYQKLIQDAFEEPRRETEEQQKVATTEFQNKYFAACLVSTPKE